MGSSNGKEKIPNQNLILNDSPFREPTLKTLGLVIILAWGFSFLVLDRITFISQEKIKATLHTILQSSQHSLNIWAKERKADVQSLARKPEVINQVLELLKLPPESETLKNSDSLQKLRLYFQPDIESHNYDGFFIVNPDQINIASMRDSNMGLKNLMTNEFLNKALSGLTLLNLPMITDIPLLNRMGKMSNKEPTMFVASPIRDFSGKTISTLLFRINPKQYFTRALKTGRVGETGETYAFNNEGKLISGSRFDEQLKVIGVVPQSGSAMLSTEIRDPGRNLLKGFKSGPPLEKQPFTFMVQQALDKKTGINVEGYRDYRGVPVVGAWTWDENLSLGIATEIDKEEAYQLLNSIRFLVKMVLGATIFIFLGYILHLFRQSKKNIIEAQKFKVFSLAVEHSSSSIVITNKEGTIIYVNPAFYNLTGYQQDEAIGKNPRLLKSGKHPPIFYEGIWRTLLSSESWEGQICNKKKSGQVYWEHQIISPIKNKLGEISHFISVKLDDTKRKQSMERLEATISRIEESNKKLSEFINTASHDLQAPLRKVLTFAERLRKRTSSLDDKSREYIQRMEGSAQRMQDLVVSLLEYSKLSGKPMTYSSVDLNQVAKEVIEDLEFYISEKNAVINLKNLPSVKGVPYQIAQLFQNLISNAIKFVEEDQIPIVNISASKIASKEWKIIFKDNGIGINSKYVQRIFNPLERLHGVSKYPGAGMGLAICKKIVEDHKGTISVESEVGKGTSFIITLVE